jgi:hypothetical protein
MRVAGFLRYRPVRMANWAQSRQTGHDLLDIASCVANRGIIQHVKAENMEILTRQHFSKNFLFCQNQKTQKMREISGLLEEIRRFKAEQNRGDPCKSRTFHFL